MKIGKIKLKFCHFDRDNIRIKSSMLASGIILFFLGMQGIFNIVNGLDLKIFKLQILTYTVLIIGIFLILSFIISCHCINRGENTPLINPDYQNI